MVHLNLANLRNLVGCVQIGIAVLLTTTPANADEFDPFQFDAWSSIPLTPVHDPFDSLTTGKVAPQAPVAAKEDKSAASHNSPAAYPVRPTSYVYQPTATPPTLAAPPQSASRAPSMLTVGCGTPNEKPLNQLSIQIPVPQGELPADRASACWQELNASKGPLAAGRFWARQCYAWDATCMAHRPLYFEEINLERYGYGCHDCLQPFASAAHFFATVPALPYCMAADCPGECQYTLGHYRPGSCPPWRCHRPPVSARGGISEAGVLTGLIFLIP